MKTLLITIISVFCISAMAKEVKSEILSIKGYLYYHSKGEWSKNIFDKEFHIWNPIIGEGSLKGPSDRTLFEIEANGSDLHNVVIKVEQIWKGQTKTILETTKKFSFRKKGESMKIPVLVENTTVGTYVVTAVVEPLAGEPVGQPKIARVEYGGGE